MEASSDRARSTPVSPLRSCRTPKMCPSTTERMTSAENWVPSRRIAPSTARTYDRFLGGKHPFAVDREVAERAITVMPELPAIARANRAFLHRAVRLAVSRGIRQFLDIGSGIPTEANVHEAARAAD